MDKEDVVAGLLSPAPLLGTAEASLNLAIFTERNGAGECSRRRDGEGSGGGGSVQGTQSKRNGLRLGRSGSGDRAGEGGASGRATDGLPGVGESFQLAFFDHGIVAKGNIAGTL